MRLLHQFVKATRLIWTARFRRALRHGVGAADQHVPVLRALLPPPSLIVDVGAHRGQFLLAALEACPEARVIVIEPQPSAQARLRAWLDHEADRARVTLRAVAIADWEGEALFHVANRDDNSSLRLPTAAQTRLFPGTDTPDTIQVPVTRLDRLLAGQEMPPDALLKVDVQGSEAEVLRGAGDLLRRFRWVYVECSRVELYEGQVLADDVVTLMREQGFDLRACHNAITDKTGRDIQADYLFVRADPA